MSDHDMILKSGRTLEFMNAMTQSKDTWSTAGFAEHLEQYPDQTVSFYTDWKQYWKMCGSPKMKSFSAKAAIQFLKASGRL